MEDIFSDDDKPSLVPVPSSRESVSSGARRGKKDVQKICIVPKCDEAKKPNAKLCRRHNCHADNVKYNASKAGEEQKTAVAKGMKDDALAIEMVEEWQEKNIASGLFKNGVVDWAEWNKKFGLTVSIDDTSRRRPFEKMQFIIRQVNKFGRTKEEAKNMWNEAEAGQYARDYRGYQGQLRLWLDDKEFQDRKRSIYIDEGALEGSNKKKKIKDSDRDATRVHVHELANAHADEFFHGQSSLAHGSEKRRLSFGAGESDREEPKEASAASASQTGDAATTSPGAERPRLKRVQHNLRTAPSTLILT